MCHIKEKYRCDLFPDRYRDRQVTGIQSRAVVENTFKLFTLNRSLNLGLTVYSFVALVQRTSIPRDKPFVMLQLTAGKETSCLFEQ